MSSNGTAAKQHTDAWFVTTHWSVVLKAGQHDSTRAHDALARLCQTYWYPLYAYVRRRGFSAHDAQDLTQTFFAGLLARESFATADPARGRFRSFLLGAMNHFIAKEWRAARAQKRGGGQALMSLDLAMAEERFDLEPASDATPDRVFDQEWATALLSKVLEALETEYRRAGRGEQFEVLKPTLAGSRDGQPYEQLARQLRANEGAVKTAVHRLRKRYRQLLEAEIAQTVSTPEEVRDELRYLLTVVAR